MHASSSCMECEAILQPCMLRLSVEQVLLHRPGQALMYRGTIALHAAHACCKKLLCMPARSRCRQSLVACGIFAVCMKRD